MPTEPGPTEPGPAEPGPTERAPTAGELATARSAPVPPLVTRIKRRDQPGFVRALAIGAVGGGIFALLDLPLAWMMGAMIANAIAAFAGGELRMDVRLRAFMSVVLGIMLGSAFSPEILGRMAQWWITLVALVVYVGATGAVAFGFFRAVGGHDPGTAYFAGVPGGLNEMILLGGAMGGDDRAIRLTHSTRIFLVVMTIPFLFRALAEGAPVARAAAGGASIAPIDIVLLAASAVAGIFLARLVRLPAPALTGAMIGSAAVHLAGLTEAAPPREVVAAAQPIIGTSIGIRFSGVPISHDRPVAGTRSDRDDRDDGDLGDLRRRPDAAHRPAVPAATARLLTGRAGGDEPRRPGAQRRHRVRRDTPHRSYRHHRHGGACRLPAAGAARRHGHAAAAGGPAPTSLSAMAPDCQGAGSARPRNALEFRPRANREAPRHDRRASLDR